MEKPVSPIRIIGIILSVAALPLCFLGVSSGSFIFSGFISAVYIVSAILSFASYIVYISNGRLAKRINSILSLSAFSKTCFAVNLCMVSFMLGLFAELMKALSDFFT